MIQFDKYVSDGLVQPPASSDDPPLRQYKPQTKSYLERLCQRPAFLAAKAELGDSKPLRIDKHTLKQPKVMFQY